MSPNTFGHGLQILEKDGGLDFKISLEVIEISSIFLALIYPVPHWRNAKVNIKRILNYQHHLAIYN